MVDGVVLKFDTAKAVDAQKQFEASTRGTFVSMEEQGKRASDLETQMRAMAAAAETAARAQDTLAKQRPQAGPSGQDKNTAASLFGQPEGISRIAAAEASLRAEAALRRQAEAAGAAAQAQSVLGREAKASSVSIDAAGRSSNATSQFLTKLLNATGATGAAKGFSLLASGAKALTASINPVGLATGFAAAAILTLATQLVGAESATERFRREARQAQQDVNGMADAVSAAASALDSIAGSRQKFAPFEGAEQEGRRLQGVYDELVKRQTELSERIARTPTGVFDVTAAEVEKLGEALQKPPRFFRDLEAAQTGSGRAQEAAIARLREEIGLRVEEGVLLLSSEKLQRNLKGAIDDTAFAIEENNRALARQREFDGERALGDITRNLERQIELERLGTKERETRIRIDEQRAKLSGPITDGQQREIDLAIAAARAADQREKAERDMAEAAAKRNREQREAAVEAEREASARDELTRAYQDAKVEIEKQAALLALEETEREKLSIVIALNEKAKRAELVVDQDLIAVHERLADRLVEQRKRNEENARALQEARDATDRLATTERERQDILRRVREDTELLLTTTDKERRAKESLAQLNDALARTETVRGSAAANELTAAFARLDEAMDFDDRRRELTQLGEETFGAIGQNIVAAVQNGANFRQFLGGVAQDLAQIAAQRFIIDQLTRLGGTLFGSAASRPQQQPQGSALNTFYGYGANNALGSVLPSSAGPTFAANGLILDRFQTFIAGGKPVTTNEGGAATPEAIVPLERDRYGRLGVAASGMGDNYTFVLPNVRSGEQARQIRPTLRQTVESVGRAQQRGRSGGLRGGV